MLSKKFGNTKGRYLMENNKKKNILNHAALIAVIGFIVSILIMNTAPEIAVAVFIGCLAYYFYHGMKKK
jgi:preprotein translocase subunit SecG